MLMESQNNIEDEEQPVESQRQFGSVRVRIWACTMLKR